jgi:ferredoxin
MPIKMFHVGLGYPPKPEEKPVTIIYHSLKDGEEKKALAREGETLLEVAHNNEIELEGACAQSLACSTCHVILYDDIYDKLKEPCDEELDLLDLAYGLTMTSRLGC